MNLPPQQTVVDSLTKKAKNWKCASTHTPWKCLKFPKSSRILLLTTKEKGKVEPEKFIIFALTEILLLIQTIKDMWLSDGSFKQRSDMFYRLYAINVTIGDYNPSCIHALTEQSWKNAMISPKPFCNYYRFYILEELWWTSRKRLLMRFPRSHLHKLMDAISIFVNPFCAG